MGVHLTEWVGPLLGSVVFLYGGRPFLAGAVTEIRDRAPGMMLLISIAVTVAYVASAATALGLFGLDFWWELAALVAIMLLGHWQEMKAIGQAQGALSALAALLPDDAERVDEQGVPGLGGRLQRRRDPAGRRRTGLGRGHAQPRDRRGAHVRLDDRRRAQRPAPASRPTRPDAGLTANAGRGVRPADPACREHGPTVEERGLPR